MDFEHLYEALHQVAGEEEEYPNYSGSRIRILGICYDLRHALMGDRDIEFISNGPEQEDLMYQSVIVPDKNMYLKVDILWPEAIWNGMPGTGILHFNF